MGRFRRWLVLLLDYWVPDAVRYDPVKIRQSRLLIGLIYLICLPQPVFIPFHIFLGQHKVLLLSLFLVLSFGGLLVYLRRTGKADVVTQFLLIFGLSGVLLTALQAGGIHSVVAGYLAVMPVMAFAMLSRKWGYIWAMISALAILGLLLLEVTGNTPAVVVDEQSLPMAIAMNQMTLLVFVLGTFLFLDEINRFQRTALIEARDEAQRASSVKSGFLANMSHELRTPLNGILGLTEVLMTESALPTQHNETLSVILRSGQGLSQLLDDLLDFSKLEEDRVELEQIPVSFPELVDEVVLLLQERARGQGVRLWVDRHPDVGWGEGDPARLRQVLLNLVGNAVKFTHDGEVCVRCHRDKSNLYVSVVDSGIGIDPQTLPMLFEPFTQADVSMSRRFGGSGLGLSISRRLVRLMRGDITVTSEPRQGSVFSFWLPFPLCAAPEDSVKSTTPVSLSPELRVLVAEDNLINQEVIRRMLSTKVAQVTIVSSGEAVLEAVLDDVPDVILMDIQMPLMDGLTAARTLRAQGISIPIIALTASALPADRAAAQDAGMSHFLAKPVSRERLYTVLTEATQR